MEGVPKSRIDHCKFISHCVVNFVFTVLDSVVTEQTFWRPAVGMLWWGTREAEGRLWEKNSKAQPNFLHTHTCRHFEMHGRGLAFGCLA